LLGCAVNTCRHLVSPNECTNEHHGPAHCRAVRRSNI
jgi:hypothetical protein